MPTAFFRRVSCLFVAALMLLPATTQAEPTAEQWGTILNLSGRQRMLTQKMSKEYCLIAAGVDADANRENLKQTMGLFETTLKGLRDGDANVNLPATGNERIVKQLDKVAGLYAPLQAKLAAAAGGESIDAAGLAVIAENNVPLLKDMNKAVKMYERSAKKVLGDNDLAVVINLAGRQRMLTQKMSKELLLVHLDVDTDNNRLNLRETMLLFDQTLNGLIDGDTDLELPATTDASTRDQLLVVKDLWQGFQPVIAKGTDAGNTLSDANLNTLAKSNLPLLKNMNQAVKLFEGMAATQQVSQVAP